MAGKYCQRRPRAGDRAAQAVVGDDVLALRGQRGRLASESIRGLVAADDQHALAGGIELAFRERLEKTGRFRIALEHEGANRFDLLVALAECQLVDRGAVEGPGGGG